METLLLKSAELKHFQFVVIGLEELQPEQASKLVESVCDCLLAHRATLECISSIWIIGYWGILVTDDSQAARLAAVSELLRSNGNLIRVAHGQCTSIAGLMGSRHRFSYNAVIPGFQEIRERLSETPFGAAFEVPEKPMSR